MEEAGAYPAQAGPRASPPAPGIINETFAFEIKGAKDPELLHVKGRVIGPTFHFDVDELDFGTVPFNFVNQKMFHMVNTSEIPMRYTLRVPQDKTGDGREFTITPARLQHQGDGRRNILHGDFKIPSCII